MRELKVPKPWRKPKKKLTQKRVRELFDYDETTGDLIKKIATRGPNGKVGSIIRTKDSNGYYQVMVDGWVRMVHRVIWVWVHGYDVENQIDHIDRCKTNNIISNLREVGISCNMRNTGVYAHNTSGIKGVSWYSKPKKWCGSIKINGINMRLGQFTDIVEATAHRLAAEQCLGWAGCDSNSPAYQYMQEYVKRES